MSAKSDRIIEELGYKPTKTKAQQPVTPLAPQNRDLFQTPNYAVDLLLPFIPEDKVHTVWEPASGDGKIVRRILEKTDLDVYASDIRESVYINNEIRNFLIQDLPPVDMLADGNFSIITNPPFSLKRQFYNRCRYFNVPFALLIPAEYCGWLIRAIQEGAEKIIPTRRIDFITPKGKSGATGQTADFHSMWLTWGFNLGKTETFVELSLEDKKENI